MGAPMWSLDERDYFVKVILPLSKYAGGTYSKPEGLGWAELAAIMQEELDRKGVSRRKYTSDMLFQHYYQKCSSRSYKRGEGDNMVVPEAVTEASSSGMSPPPLPKKGRRTVTKKPSKKITYVTKATQTEISIEAGSESESAIQRYPKFAGPLASEHGAHFEVPPIAALSSKRKYQATVEDTYDDDAEKYDFVLKEEVLEEDEQIPRKKKTLGSRASGSEARNRSGESMYSSSIGDFSELFGVRSSEPERARSAKLQDPWAKSSEAQSRIPFGGSRHFNSPHSDTRSAGTSTIAYKTYTPTPLFEAPFSVSDTNRPLGVGFNMAKALLEERSRPASRASDRSESVYDGFRAVPSPLRELSRDLYGEESGIRGTSRKLRSPGVESSRSAYRYSEDFFPEDFLRSRRNESSGFGAYREEPQSSRYPRSSQRESSRFGAYREVSEAPSIPRTSGFHGNMAPRMSAPKQEGYDDEWYFAGRPTSPFGPTRYQDSRVMEEDLYHDDEPIRRSKVQPYRFSPSAEPRSGNTESPTTTQRPAAPSRPTTPSCPPLSGYRIRKRSQLQPSSSVEQDERTPQVSVPTKERIGENPSTPNGLDAE
jgi:hypothetical protein